MTHKNLPTTVEEFACTKDYLSSLLFSFGFPISEYDISKANINILRSFQKISEEDYQKLLILPKMDREIEIGKRIKGDWQIQEIITQGIARSKYQFLSLNQINLNNILRIANDAFYLIGNNPINTTIVIPKGGTTPVEFKFKKVYNFYMKLNSILFLCNNSGDEYDLDVIGIGDQNLELHHDFLTFLCQLSDKYIYGGKEMAIRFVNEFHHKYVSDQLDIGYYREFNSTGWFRYPGIGEGTYVSMFPIGTKGLDKNYNLNLIRTIYSYLLAS